MDYSYFMFMLIFFYIYWVLCQLIKQLFILVLYDYFCLVVNPLHIFTVHFCHFLWSFTQLSPCIRTHYSGLALSLLLSVHIWVLILTAWFPTQVKPSEENAHVVVVTKPSVIILVTCFVTYIHVICERTTDHSTL